MLKLIERTLLTSTMGFAWNLISVGERVIAYAESWKVTKANEQHASFVEFAVWRAGNAIVGMGERLEVIVNGFAMRLGYNDGEVSALSC